MFKTKTINIAFTLFFALIGTLSLSAQEASNIAMTQAQVQQGDFITAEWNNKRITLQYIAVDPVRVEAINMIFDQDIAEIVGIRFYTGYIESAYKIFAIGVDAGGAKYGDYYVSDYSPNDFGPCPSACD